jgi:hypothetical protein
MAAAIASKTSQAGAGNPRKGAAQERKGAHRTAIGASAAEKSDMQFRIENMSPTRRGIATETAAKYQRRRVRN